MKSSMNTLIKDNRTFINEDILVIRNMFNNIPLYRHIHTGTHLYTNTQTHDRTHTYMHTHSHTNMYTKT